MILDQRVRLTIVASAAALLLLAGCATAPADAPPLAWTPFPTAADPVETNPAAGSDAVIPAAVSGACANSASFLEDLTLPDGSLVAPGQILLKRWSVENSGSCDWGPGYTLQPMWDNPFSDVGVQGLYPARTGAVAVWAVEFVAPQETGTYFARWQAYDPDGQPFGDEVYLLIEVVAPAATETEAVQEGG
ncbi:MAG: hypothetical protein JXA97_03605 [Anaerolineales bacterium]|nr:hypothetical protein [Anaerolineales bacterium]